MKNLWFSSGGFLATGMELPVLALVAMGRNSASLAGLTRPVGKTLGLLSTVVCYLALGPLSGTPRTASLSYN